MRQRLRAAEVAQSSTKTISKLMDHRANDEGPRIPVERKAAIGADLSDSRKVQRRVRQPSPPPSSGSEPFEWERAKSEQPSRHVPRPASGRKQSKSSTDDRGYRSRSAGSPADQRSSSWEMRAEMANLVLHQRRQHRAADDRHGRCRPQHHRGREDRRGARTVT